MITIEIHNPCSCAKKRKSWTKDLTFSTLQKAQQVAQEMVEQGNTKFCKKHRFEMSSNESGVIISTFKATL